METYTIRFGLVKYNGTSQDQNAQNHCQRKRTGQNVPEYPFKPFGERHSEI